MSQRHILQDGTGVIASLGPKGKIFVTGTTVPTNASIGYATGCIFAKTDGGAGTSLYLNEGTNTSSTFNAIGASGTGATLAGNNAFTGNNSFATGTFTLTDINITLGTGTGTKIAGATSQKLGFWGATPVIQQASANQAAITTTVGSGVATTGATNSSPYGYAQAQADAIVTNVNALRVDLLAMNTLLTQLRLDLVTTGVIKGEA